MTDDRMEATLANVQPGIVLANARRIAKREHARKPNWVLAMEVFGLGSTYARGMCKKIGVDPDAIGKATLQ